MRLLLLCVMFLGLSCASEEPSPPLPSTEFSVTTMGDITDRRISEISGMARSTLHEGILWVLNDSGDNAHIYAISQNGDIRATVSIYGVQNYDWEDLSSFNMDGESYLLIADIGGNVVFRDVFHLYVIKEPMLEATTAPVVWKLSFEYDNGARDAEAVAVDTAQEKILLLSKRDVPALLYELPLRPQTSELLIAQQLGEITSIPQPTEDEVQRRLDRYHAQPTGMDISADGASIAVLTYRRAFLYERRDNESWLQTLNRTPRLFEFPRLEQAEALCFDEDGTSLYITSEKLPAPLIRLTYP